MDFSLFVQHKLNQHKLVIFAIALSSLLFSILILYSDADTALAAPKNQPPTTQQGYYSLSTCGPVYGNFWGGDQIDNEIIGRSNQQQLSIRWKSEYSGQVTKFRWHSKYASSNPGYSAGDGGELLLTFRSDDGNGLPSSQVLASAFVPNPLSIGYFPQITWSAPVTVTAGDIYHVVFTNVHSNPTTNYISINGLYLVSSNPLQECLADSDAALLYTNTFLTTWVEKGNRSPGHEFYFSDGRTQGLGYIHTWDSISSNHIKYIEGNRGVREIFTLSFGDIDVVDISARVSKNAGNPTGDLTAQLVDVTNNSVIDSCTLPESTIVAGCPQGCVNAGTITYVGFDYATCQWPNGPHTLLDGNTYAMELSAPSGDPYTSFVMQEGRYVGFSSESYFDDGHAEFTTNGGSTWNLWTNWNGSSNVRDDTDLQIFMRLFVPNTPPTVTITSPLTNSTFYFGDIVNFDGAATDAEDGDLTSAIGWTSTIDGAIGTGGQISTTALSLGSHILTAEVMDSSSVTSTAAVSITIALANTPPTVTITSPLTNSTFYFGDIINIDGAATDAEDGDLTSAIGWTSTIDGAIGSGGQFNVNGLALGTHILTAEVMDSANVTAAAAVTVTVALTTPQMVAPSSTITNPSPTFEWMPVVGATDYELAIYNVDTDIVELLNSFSNSTTGCSSGATNCLIQPSGLTLAPGNYTWLVRATNGSHISAWAVYPP